MQNMTDRASTVLWVGDIATQMMAFTVAFFYARPTPPQGLNELLSVRVEISTGLLVVAYVVCWHLILRLHGLYRLGALRRGAPWWEVSKAVMVGNALLWVAVLPVNAGALTFLSVMLVGSFVGAQVLHGGVRVLLGLGQTRSGRLKNVAIVGCGPQGASLGREIWERPGLGYLLVGYLDDMPPPRSPLHGDPERLLGSLEQLESVIVAEHIDEIFIALPVKSHYEKIAQVIRLCEESGVVVRMPAGVFEGRIAKSRIDHLGDVTLLTLETPRPRSSDLILKRAVDVMGSAIALVMLTPVFAITALAIKLGSPGPVIFKQQRVGLGGRTFPLLKFRTMICEAETRQDELEAHNEVHGAAFKMAHDPRVTTVGRLLRKLSVDEFPQFLNVLTGDMSLVGPRPLPVRDVQRFDANWLNRRFSVKPGLTCLWQANGRHDLSFRHWMELDLQYIDHWSLKLDWEIIAKTIPAILRGGGAS